LRRCCRVCNSVAIRQAPWHKVQSVPLSLFPVAVSVAVAPRPPRCCPPRRPTPPPPQSPRAFASARQPAAIHGSCSLGPSCLAAATRAAASAKCCCLAALSCSSRNCSMWCAAAPHISWTISNTGRRLKKSSTACRNSGSSALCSSARYCCVRPAARYARARSHQCCSGTASDSSSWRSSATSGSCSSRTSEPSPIGSLIWSSVAVVMAVLLEYGKADMGARCGHEITQTSQLIANRVCW
jgi:hypothetical protein